MHLVLRRSPGQSIVIGKNAEIKITYHRQENDVIHLGIDSPKDITVDRLEIHEKKMKEARQK